jgi:hypothetical protein
MDHPPPPTDSAVPLFTFPNCFFLTSCSGVARILCRTPAPAAEQVEAQSSIQIGGRRQKTPHGDELGVLWLWSISELRFISQIVIINKSNESSIIFSTTTKTIVYCVPLEEIVRVRDSNSSLAKFLFFY